MHASRTINKTWSSVPVIEGDGVHLKRAFGNNMAPQFDPFLLLDDFRSDNPDHYRRGFPWHPHRGIETITYIQRGSVEHSDSLGNKGTISAGDVQWMTSGSGIIHQEMPAGDKEGIIEGFQLWANLPRSHKMMEPRYRDIKSHQIPEVRLANGVHIKIICGKIGTTEGSVQEIISDPEYLDVSIPAGAQFTHPTALGHTVFAFVIGGEGYFDQTMQQQIGNGTVCLYTDGDGIAVTTTHAPVRFLLISGKPIGEPVAWYGPIVMNSEEELQLALTEFRDGTFIKHKKPLLE